ncbi:Retrovirus-related Pol polyprotein from transposon RE1 (Retro element 1) (AtRE1) [Includes: Protease RE1 [Durusdinium trenchii]|uniref:Retrovirus-related Pol polyprotein from transposon RE1 (Retro element 1) (AtRE1) n=1 Tax=Durusdinium trenchii TaxID=1381693 RepID=A0ABP0IVB6_9DINO
MTVTKSKDGIPAWDGTPSTWSEYRRAAYMYEETVKWESRYLCGPRLAAELTGAARTAIANKKRGWLSSQDGVGKLLRCLKETMSEPALPEISNQLKTYFKLLRRRRGESMVSFCVRHREEYARTCKALTRVMREQKPGTQDEDSRCLRQGHPQGGGSSDLATEGDTEATPTEDNGEEAQDETEWTWDDAWWWSTWETTWNWNLQSNTSIAEEDEDDEEDFVEILPDVIKGWLLLEKANLDGMERSLIQSEVKNNFSLANVEVALRSHFTDETIKKRDGEAKQALYENEEDETEPWEEDTSFYEDLPEDALALYQQAKHEEHEAWAQLQQARVTLREARAKQHENEDGKNYEAVEHSEYVYGVLPDSACVKPEAFCWTNLEEASPDLIPGDQVLREGYGVLDGGATKTMASVNAIEQLQDKARRLNLPGVLRGSAPILVSVATLRKLGAIIDFRTDEAVFTAVSDRTLVKLKRSTTGHQLIPLTQDFLESGMTLANRVMSLRQLEATAAQVTMWPDKSMKPHYLLSKTECTQELEANGQKRIAWTEFTLPECRMLVRESREAQGIIKPKGAPNNLVKEINNAKLGELRSMCQARQIEHPAKATAGELRLMLKSWLIHSGNNETLIDFGKYKGMSFMEVAQHDPGYLSWAQAEVGNSDTADWRLRQLASWAERMEHNPLEKSQAPVKNQGAGYHPALTNSRPTVAIAAGSSSKDVDAKASASAMTEQVKDMMETMKAMQEELDELKGKKRHKTSLEQASELVLSEANLEVHTDRWRSVQIDTAYWKHPISKKQVSFSLIMDEASRFLVGKVMRMDGGKGVKASEYAELFTSHWFPYFGMPDVVRSDPEGAFRSEEMLNFFSERGIHLDHIPAEAHWNLSHVERCIEWVKEFLTKTAGDAEQDVTQLIQHAIYTWNHRETVRGYSPFQHAIGRQPDIEGRVFDRRTTDLPMEMMQSPDGEMEVASQLRQQASKAFIDWPASMRETCLHELTRPPQLPWTFNSLAGDLHKASFQDHTGPGPSENKRSLVEPEELDDTEHPTNRRRVTGKQQQSRQQDRSRSPKPSRSEDAALFTGPSWQELVPESAWLTTDTRTTWDNPHAAVELTLELPTDQRKLRRFMNNPVAYFVSALKRRSVEVSERHLSALEHEQFAGAKKIEVDKFIAAEALQALPEHLQPARHQALRMRWVLTWKHSEDGSSKPKARAVVLGYMDPEYQHRPTFAPTMTRHSRQMLIQWASNHGCQVKKGDVAAAFLQGREFSRDLYLIPTVEICEAMNLAPQSVVKMRKACYGLVEAPIEWFETMNQNQSQKAQTSVALKHLQASGPKRAARAGNWVEPLVLAYQSFVQHVHREEDLDQPAFHGLSELRLAAYRKLILKAPFLREQKKHVISMMVSSLSDLIYLPADFIVCSGDTGRELFFMRRGVAGVYPSGPECPPVMGESTEVAVTGRGERTRGASAAMRGERRCKWSKAPVEGWFSTSGVPEEYTAGKYFGELGMLTARPRAAWIMAKTYCVLSVPRSTGTFLELGDGESNVGKASEGWKEDAPAIVEDLASLRSSQQLANLHHSLAFHGGPEEALRP